jgi:hypothetical protein
MTTTGLSVRVWNGTSICRRDDGFVNATAMCKANAKRWTLYRTNERTKAYMAALAGSVGIPTHLLIDSITTGPNATRGTWIHPRLAVDLARWISPQFAVWMDGWFLESLQPKPTTDAFAGNGRVDYILTLLHDVIGTIDPSGSFKPGNCDVFVNRLDPPLSCRPLRNEALGDARISTVRRLRAVAN